MKKHLYMLIFALAFMVALLLATVGVFFGYLSHLKAMWEWESGLHKHAIAQWACGAAMVAGFCGVAYCGMRDISKPLILRIFR